ncbi:MAG: PDZ domain-containing protein [Polyangia bacterium]
MTALFLAGGCDSGSPIALASIESVQPRVLEPGDMLSIEGSGFVEGPARLSLDGEFDSPGPAAPERRAVELRATAVGTSRLELPITPLVMERLAVRPARFSGVVEVEFPAALEGSAVRVEARSEELTLELRPAGVGVACGARLRRRAEMLLDEIGLEMSAGDGDRGLVVGAVAPGSLADRSGFEPGDRLLAADGTALASLGDVAGLDRSEPHRLSIVSQTGETREIIMGSLPGSTLAPDEVAAVLLSAVALGVFLAFAAPARRRPARHEPRDKSDPLLRSLGIGAISVPILALPAVAIHGRFGLEGTLLLVGACAGGGAARGLLGKGSAPSRILDAVLRPLAPLSALGVAAAFGSTFDLSGLVAGQNGSPWGWYAWTNPAAAIATAAAVALIWPRADGKGGGARRGPRIASWIAALAGAATITCCALGGWGVPGVPLSRLAESPGWMLAGVALFTAKCWLVLLAARWAAGADLSERRERRGTGRIAIPAAALAASVPLALAWQWAELPPRLDSAGRVLAAATTIALATTLTLRWIGRLRPGGSTAAQAAIHLPASGGAPRR